MVKQTTKVIIVFLTIMLSSCSLTTKIQGEFLLSNRFRLVEEYVDDQVLSNENRWFTVSSGIQMNEDETYELKLFYKTSDELNLKGTYTIYVGEVGHSGAGYLYLGNKKIPVIFEKSYDIIFTLPVEYNVDNNQKERTLRFRR